MKKLLMALAVILMAGLSKASANNPTDINGRALAAFHSEFSRAKNVSWSESPKYVVAEFSLDNKVMYAYYSHDGSFIAVLRHLLTSDLPEALRVSLRKEYGSYWVSELFKVDTDQGSTYYVSLENEIGSIALSSADDSTWQTFKITNSSVRESASF